MSESQACGCSGNEWLKFIASIGKGKQGGCNMANVAVGAGLAGFCLSPNHPLGFRDIASIPGAYRE